MTKNPDWERLLKKLAAYRGSRCDTCFLFHYAVFTVTSLHVTVLSGVINFMEQGNPSMSLVAVLVTRRGLRLWRRWLKAGKTCAVRELSNVASVCLVLHRFQGLHDPPRSERWACLLHGVDCLSGRMRQIDLFLGVADRQSRQACYPKFGIGKTPFPSLAWS